ncbi:hypothetical protein GJR96_07750 [Haloferax sp. MBLA0076]|uniref:Uncharacterized protein n=1 Tax=Haloferax litoreum TaxID=2666140 RepID=A0A6A8GG50_9EURY|nr:MULTISPECIES: hypothetical protein [Haloferax]KAB1193341.1 hypothetical protein Hfx1148_07740 [Haloferax sp. CBA1148]MRX21849.1 hypothetical protein [Haloferax litoreum]
MSTHTRPTYEPTLQTDRPSPNTTSDTTGTDSWVARCQRQFESTRTERIHNLFDRENQSMPKMD